MITCGIKSFLLTGCFFCIILENIIIKKLKIYVFYIQSEKEKKKKNARIQKKTGVERGKKSFVKKEGQREEKINGIMDAFQGKSFKE